MATTLIDELMPCFDAVERHAIVVPAPPSVVYPALRRVDLLGSRLIRWLVALRSVPAALRRPRARRGHRPLTLDGMQQAGFVLLGERPESELALGVVGRFWTPGGERVPLDADGFRAFDTPGYAKAVWDFRLTPVGAGATRLSTETRVHCLDAGSRRSFLRYWRVVQPFSGLIRLALLRAVARQATRSAAPSPWRR